VKFTSKEQLLGVAMQMSAESAVTMNVGLSMFRKAARMEQLADIMSDDEADNCLASLIEDGLVEIKADGVAVLLDPAESASSESVFPVSSPGGAA
jgi:hypothetical protein